MRKAFELKHIVPRSFLIGGLTAKWGIGENRDDRYKNPLHAWTISGREDGSEDFSPLLDKMGTGNALMLSGFDGAPGSGFENGYLAFDGVDDGAKTPGFSLGQSWTLIGDWEFAMDSLGKAGITKWSRFKIYNAESGGAGTAINQMGALESYPGVYGFRAVCSDGRLYGSDWKPYTNTLRQEVAPSTGAIHLGLFEGSAISMKFKNLAIYEGAPLSEAQCKKAYDWLQTL